jgi:hypothetical protein
VMRVAPRSEIGCRPRLKAASFPALRVHGPREDRAHDCRRREHRGDLRISNRDWERLCVPARSSPPSAHGEPPAGRSSRRPPARALDPQARRTTPRRASPCLSQQRSGRVRTGGRYSRRRLSEEWPSACADGEDPGSAEPAASTPAAATAPQSGSTPSWSAANENVALAAMKLTGPRPARTVRRASRLRPAEINDVDSRDARPLRELVGGPDIRAPTRTTNRRHRLRRRGRMVDRPRTRRRLADE